MTFFRSLLLSLALTTPTFAADLQNPESLEHDPDTGIIYVGNKEATPGQVLALATDGTLTQFATLVGKGKPHGLRIAGDALYVAHGDSVQGFRLADGRALPVIRIDGAQFLNGMASDGQSRLWLSDMLTRRIHAIELGSESTKVTTVVADTGFAPNGIEYDPGNDRLLIVGWGEQAKIAQLSLADGSFKELASTPLTNLDGVALDCRGNLYVTSWGSAALLRFDAPLFKTDPVTVLSGLDKPSDIRFVPSTGQVLVPNYGDSTISRHDTGCAGK